MRSNYLNFPRNKNSVIGFKVQILQKNRPTEKYIFRSAWYAEKKPESKFRLVVLIPYWTFSWIFLHGRRGWWTSADLWRKGGMRSIRLISSLLWQTWFQKCCHMRKLPCRPCNLDGFLLSSFSPLFAWSIYGLHVFLYFMFWHATLQNHNDSFNSIPHWKSKSKYFSPGF